MIPEEIFKPRRRHNNTPAVTMLIITNFIVTCVGLTFFAHKNHVNWFFWVVVGLLGLYNFFTIRRNREDFTQATIIAFSISLVVLVITFFVLKGIV